MNLIPHIFNGNNLTAYLDGQPFTVSAGSAQYDLALEAIEAGDVDALRTALDMRKHVVSKSFGKITLDGTTLLFGDRPLHGALVNRIITIVRDNGDASPLINFLNNLMANPSKRAVDELYGFLEKCDLPITDDGHFLAYKRVRDDYKDCHSGTLDNSVGQILEVDRNSVDDDAQRTCSFGLHFCSKSYLSSFAAGRTVVVKINPADVVAIPVDYNNAKGRTCRYEVVDEIETDGREILNDLKSDYIKSPVPADEPDPAVPTGPKPVTAKAPTMASLKAKAAPNPVGTTSLTDAQVREVRNLLSDGWPLSSIARTVGTSARTVARIRDRETYTHVK